MGSDAQCTITTEQRDGSDESNSSFLGQTSLYLIISCNIQGLTNEQKHKVQLISEQLANNENTLTITLTETHLNEKILDSEIQMKNYIGFRADWTLGKKNGGVIPTSKRPKQLMQNCWLQNLTHMLNTNSYTCTILLLLMCTVLKYTRSLYCKIVVWIHNFLSNRQQCVDVNGTTSEAQVRSGIPQGQC